MADANTITRIGGLLKIVYGDLETQFNRKAETYEMFEKSTERLGGDHFEMAARVAGNTAGIGARLSDDAIPVPTRQNIQKFTVYDRMLTGVITIFERDVLNTEGKDRAYVNHLDDEIENMIIDLTWHQNIMVFGDGTGTLATVNANTSASVSFVGAVSSSFGGFGTKYLRVGDKIDIWDPTFVTNRNSNTAVTITAINPSTGSVTTDTSLTLTAADVVVRFLSANKEYQGLHLASDNSTSVTFQGLSRATYPTVQGTLIAANGNSLNEQQLQQLESSISARSGREMDQLVASEAQLNAYVGLGQGLKRYQNTMKLDRGFNELEYNGVPLRKDTFCLPSVVYGFDKSVIKNGEVAPLKWSEEDGHILKWNAGFLKYTAIARQVGNWLYTVPSAVGRIDALAAASSYYQSGF
jgi:hypothetical protein